MHVFILNFCTKRYAVDQWISHPYQFYRKTETIYMLSSLYLGDLLAN